MASLSACQGCSPAEELHTSWGESSFCAHRVGSVCDDSMWYMCTWNVRTLLSSERDTIRGEQLKIGYTLYICIFGTYDH